MRNADTQPRRGLLGGVGLECLTPAFQQALCKYRTFSDRTPLAQDDKLIAPHTAYRILCRSQILYRMGQNRAEPDPQQGALIHR